MNEVIETQTVFNRESIKTGKVLDIDPTKLLDGQKISADKNALRPSVISVFRSLPFLKRDDSVEAHASESSSQKEAPKDQSFSMSDMLKIVEGGIKNSPARLNVKSARDDSLADIAAGQFAKLGEDPKAA